MHMMLQAFSAFRAILINAPARPCAWSTSVTALSFCSNIWAVSCVDEVHSSSSLRWGWHHVYVSASALSQSAVLVWFRISVQYKLTFVPGRTQCKHKQQDSRVWYKVLHKQNRPVLKDKEFLKEEGKKANSLFWAIVWHLVAKQISFLLQICWNLKFIQWCIWRVAEEDWVSWLPFIGHCQLSLCLQKGEEMLCAWGS